MTRSKAPQEILSRRKTQTKKPKISANKNLWSDLNFWMGTTALLIGIVTLTLGLKAGPTGSTAAPLNAGDIFTTPIEISNGGLLDLKDARVVAFGINIDYPHNNHVTGAIYTQYVPPTDTLKVGETWTVPFAYAVRMDERPLFADISIIVFYHPQFLPFWNKRTALRFRTGRGSDGSLVLQKQPAGNALELFDNRPNAKTFPIP